MKSGHFPTTLRCGLVLLTLFVIYTLSMTFMRMREHSNIDGNYNQFFRSTNRSKFTKVLTGQIPYTISNKAEKQLLKPKTILFWTKMWGEPTNVWFNMDDKIGNSKAFQSPSCKYQNCILQANRALVQKADMLLFHFADDPKWPKMRHPNQLYGHFVMESPDSVDPGYFNASAYNGRINVTIHYRYDADITIRYGYIRRKQIITKSKYKPKIPLANIHKSVVWPVSHCPVPSHRNDYVNELSKYIDVDIYGKCGNLTCDRREYASCMKKFEGNYKFYLAFENSVCKDYITEKLYRSMDKDLIPIVLGGGNYTKELPPKSYINVEDFESPRHLAEYLSYLASNETEYNEYLQWKNEFYMETPAVSRQKLFCRLCEGLHTGALQRPAYSSYEDWYYGTNGNEICNNDMVPKMRAKGNW